VAYVTVASIRAIYTALSSTEKFPDPTLSDYISEFEGIAEEYRGVAFEPRTETETIYVDCATKLLNLKHPKLRSVTSLTIDGVAVTVGDLELDKPIGQIRYEAGFPAESTVVVVYPHGFDAPTKGIARGCREYVRSCALADRSQVPRDVIGQSLDGGYTRYSTPDWEAGRPTGYLEVDRLLNAAQDFRVPF